MSLVPFTQHAQEAIRFRTGLNQILRRRPVLFIQISTQKYRKMFTQEAVATRKVSKTPADGLLCSRDWQETEYIGNICCSSSRGDSAAAVSLLFICCKREQAE